MTDILALTTHLVVDGAAQASAWYQRAFDARELSRITLPDTRLIHVELQVGSAKFMLADEFPEHGVVAPSPGAEPTCVFYLHVDEVDPAWQRALDAGAVATRPLAEAFWGEREGQLRDPFGYRWGLTERVRDVPLEEMAAAARAMFGGGMTESASPRSHDHSVSSTAA